MNRKKGALPLDAVVKEAPAPAPVPVPVPVPTPQPTADAPPLQPAPVIPEEPKQLTEDDMMVQQLEACLMHVRAGKMKAMSITFCDENGMPHHGYIVKPGLSIPLVAGLMVSLDQIKDGARAQIGAYLKKLDDIGKSEAKN